MEGRRQPVPSLRLRSSCPKITTCQGASPKAADRGLTPGPWPLGPIQSPVPKPRTNAFPPAQGHARGSCLLRDKALAQVLDRSLPCCVRKYKKMTRGVYPPDNDAKEGRGCSFHPGHPSSLSLKLGQPGPCQCLWPTEDMLPTGAEQGQSHLAGPVQGPPCPLAWHCATANHSREVTFHPLPTQPCPHYCWPLTGVAEPGSAGPALCNPKKGAGSDTVRE